MIETLSQDLADFLTLAVDSGDGDFIEMALDLCSLFTGHDATPRPLIIRTDGAITGLQYQA